VTGEKRGTPVKPYPSLVACDLLLVAFSRKPLDRVCQSEDITNQQNEDFAKEAEMLLIEDLQVKLGEKEIL
jgi:hypothetical protein